MILELMVKNFFFFKWTFSKKSEVTIFINFNMMMPQNTHQKDGWLVGFYGISTFVGYSMPDPFLYK